MKLIPNDLKFFDLLEQQATSALQASQLLKEIVMDWENKKIDIQKLKEFERECDLTTHEIMNKINRTFVTPLDREDIHLLAKKLASLVDLIQKVGSRMDLFRIEQTTSDLLELTKILAESSQVVLKAIQGIRTLKNPHLVLEYCIEINNLENLGDRAMERSVQNLFQNSYPAIEVIKWKEIYDFCEQAINSCEDIANAVEAIVVKYG